MSSEGGVDYSALESGWPLPVARRLSSSVPSSRQEAHAIDPAQPSSCKGARCE